MFKKLLFHLLLAITMFNAGSLNASNDSQLQSAQSSSSALSSKEPKKGLMGIVSYVATSRLVENNPVVAVCTAVGSLMLFAAYGGYQLKKKFVFDAQLRAMQEELMREMARSTQDVNNHVTHEVQASENRQTQHVTAQLQVLRADVTQHIDIMENNLAHRIDSNSHAVQVAISALREQLMTYQQQNNVLHAQLVTYHSALSTQTAELNASSLRLMINQAFIIELMNRRVAANHREALIVKRRKD